MRRHHASVTRMELAIEPVGFELLVNGVDAVRDDERGSFGAFGEEIAHRPVERAGHADDFTITGKQREGTVDSADSFWLAGKHAPARFVHGHVVDADE